MITENLKCHRCGHPLTLEETYDGDCEIGDTYYFICDNCGAKFECTEVTEEDKENYEFYNNGQEDISGRITEPAIMNDHCINCGHKVYVGSNFMLSDYDPDNITNEDDDKMNFVLNQCPYCGMQEVRWDTAENEKKYFPYWKEDLNED